MEHLFIVHCSTAHSNKLVITFDWGSVMLGKKKLCHWKNVHMWQENKVSHLLCLLCGMLLHASSLKVNERVT